MYCVNHPNIETNIRCASCDKPVCPSCMVYTPVGIKCSSCARQISRAARGWPKPVYLVKALGFGLVTALISGFLLGQTVSVVRFRDLLLTLMTAVIISETVSYGASRQRGSVFQVIGGVAAFIAYFVAGYLTGQPFLTSTGFNWPLVWAPNFLRFVFALIGIWLVVNSLGD